MSTFVLIHGAWHGAWCWEKVVPLLEAEGHRVVAPDLPGHGYDQTPLGEVTLQRYADRICEILKSESEPVILVGHSMGGMAITQAAEACPESIEALVYLCAFLPANGESLQYWAEQMGESLVASNMVLSQDQASVTVSNAFIIEAFYGDCDAEDAAVAKSRLQPQAVAPIVAPVSTSEESYGRVRRYYIECLQDRAIPIGMQRAMQDALPCQSVLNMNTSHSPFLSAPQALAANLSSLHPEKRAECNCQPPKQMKDSSQTKKDIMPSIQTGYIDDLIPLSLRPDVLVLLPALAQFPLPRQQIRADTAVRNTTINPIHKPIPGYDHE
jgi:pimeloyl-ACP methyl ester carboxylesterase